nr:type II toxin-antitoxin system RelE/ParE family toxin [Actinoplanes atraurantiacus]
MLFVFDPWSQAVLLVAGNKAGDWSRWYKKAIPVAEGAYETWLAEERNRRDDS